MEWGAVRTILAEASVRGGRGGEEGQGDLIAREGLRERVWRRDGGRDEHVMHRARKKWEQSEALRGKGRK